MPTTRKMLEQHIEGPIAWTAETLLPDDGLVKIDTACLAEIRATAALLRDNPLPVEALTHDDFDMPACRVLMAGVQETLDRGTGFAILDALPVDEMDEAVAKSVYWILLSMLGNTVAQKWNGLMLYDVTDTGRTSGPGKGVRGSTTNYGQGYHTDNSYNLPPNYVSLLCLQTAMEGGISGLVSFYAAHNVLLEEHEEVLPRLYRPFYFERHREHAPEDCLYSRKPIFEYDGETLGVALSTVRVRDGYVVADERMDNETAAALAALDTVLEDPRLGKSFVFDRGQIQIVNNRTIGHRRTAFKDWPEAERQRHLVRIWVRNHGRRFYGG